MILITGAAGKTGKAVLQALSGCGEAIRALVRQPEQVGVLTHLGAAETVYGDFCDPQALQAACQDIRAIYHICPNMHPDETAIGAILIATARAAGVEKFVYHSVLHPQVEAMPHHWNKMRVEELLFASGLSYTILQPAAYMQNVLAYWNRITQDGVYPVPYHPATRLSMVDLSDVAEAAAHILLEEDHHAAIYECCGGEALSQDEVTEILSAELGFPVRAEQVLLTAWEKQARDAQMNPYARETLLKMFQYYDKYGFVGNPNGLTWLLQRLPTSFDSFIKRTIADKQSREK